jgi:predicted transcriptional regulator
MAELTTDELNSKLKMLVDALPQGREHPISISSLAATINTNKRTTAAYVAYLIKHKNVPIGSSRDAPAGVYLITNETERASTIGPIERQATEELKRANSLRRIDLDKWRDDLDL